MNLIIICVETRKRANTDPAYIDNAIKHFYKIDNQTRILYKYFDGKCKYKKRAFINEIKDDRKAKAVSHSSVIYCIDTDKLSDPDRKKENDAIKVFCQSKGYYFVWMCESVEEVFLHKKVPDSSKVDEAKRFARTGGIGVATKQTLSSQGIKNQRSNLLTVLDKILTRK